MLPLERLGPHASAISWFVTRGEHHGMNRCLRSLSCLLTASALALFATEATAKTNPKPQPPKQQRTKTQDAKKPHDAKKEARPQHHATAGKRRGAQADPKKKSKQAKDAAPSNDAVKETVKETTKQGPRPLTGDLALVKEA